MVSLLRKMDDNISKDVAEMNGQYGNLLAVDLRLVPGTDDHRWCSADPWFFGASIGLTARGNPAPFHPTPQGQSAIGEYLAAHIQKWLTSNPRGRSGYVDRPDNQIIRTTTTGAVRPFSAGISAGAGLRAIAEGPNGDIWFTEDAQRVTGRTVLALGSSRRRAPWVS